MHVARATTQHDVPVVQQVGLAQRPGDVALLHVVDVGPTRLDGAPGIAPRLGEAGPGQEVNQTEAAVEQLGPTDLGRRGVLGHGEQQVLAQAGDLLAEEARPRPPRT